MAGRPGTRDGADSTSPFATLPLTSFLPLPNIFVNLRRDSSASVVASGVLPELNQAIYVEDAVDRRLSEWVREPGQIKLFILTGSAGHGKSAAIARACSLANAIGRDITVRFDATHSSSPKASYRSDLESFLEPFEDGRGIPDGSYLLAMNLGLALDFFSGDQSALRRWSGLAGVIDDRFRLGLDVSGPRRTDVELMDLSDRFELGVSNGLPNLQFLSELLDRLSISNDSSPVSRAVKAECAGCPRRGRCPVRLNAQLLSNPTLQRNLIQTVIAAAVKDNVHLTPRNVLDLLSQLVLPPDYVHLIGSGDEVCALKSAPEQDVRMEAGWGERLSRTLFELAFPYGDQVTTLSPAAQSTVGTNRLLRALTLEDPAAIRTSEWDDQILLWAADHATLFSQLPPDLVTYLESASQSLGKNGYATLIRARRWTTEEPKERGDAQRLSTFVALCVGESVQSDIWRKRLAAALQRAASGRSFDSAGGGQRPKVALNISETASNFEILAVLEDLVVTIEPRLGGRSANHAGFNVVARPKIGDSNQIVTLPIDWPTFDLLWEISDGYFPSTVGGPHHLFLRNLRAKLVQASTMAESVTVRELGEEGEVQLEAKGSVPKLKIEVEVRR
jgi:hypothetical protein